MKRPILQRQILLASLAAGAAVVVAGLGCIGWPILRERWLLHQLGSASYLDRKEACEALGKVGTARAVPILFERFAKEGQTASRGCEIYWNAILSIGEPAVPHLVKALASGEPGSRIWAAQLLGAIANHKILAEEQKQGRFRDFVPIPYVPDRVPDPMPPSVLAVHDALIAQLGTEDEVLSQNVMEALQRLGLMVIPALVRVLEDGEGPAREAVAILLAQAARDERAYAALKNAQESLSAEGRRAAIEGRWDALLNARDAAGEAAKTAWLKAEMKDIETALARELESPDAAWRERVLWRLKSVDAFEAETGRKVAGALRDSEPRVRAAAAEALSGKKAAAALDGLVAALADPEEDVRREAMAAVVSLGEWNQATRTALARLLGDDTINRAAFVVLREAGAAIVPLVLEALEDPLADVRRGAGDAFFYWVEHGNDEERRALRGLEDRVLSALEKSLTDPEGSVREAAARAIGTISYGLRSDDSRIRTLLRDQDPHRRRGAVKALVPSAPPAPGGWIPLLLQGLKDGDPEVRAASANGLRFSGKAAGDVKAAEIVPALIAALADPVSEEVVEGAAGALGRLGASAMASAAALEGLLRESPSTAVRLAALKALARIHGGNANRLGAVILEALRDADPKVQAKALSVIAQNPGKVQVPASILLDRLKVAQEDEIHILVEPILQARHGAAAVTVLLDRLRLLDKVRGGPAADPAEAIASALADIGRRDAAQIPVLVDALREERLRASLISALGEIGPRARRAAPELRRIAQSGDLEHEVEAAWALEAVEQAEPAGEEEADGAKNEKGLR